MRGGICSLGPVWGAGAGAVVLVSARGHFCEIDGQGAGGMQFQVLVQVLFADDAVSAFLRIGGWVLGGCCSGGVLEC